jgi:hypothetical protein
MLQAQHPAERVGYRRGDAVSKPKKRRKRRKPGGKQPNQYSDHLGPYSRVHRLAKVDLRTSEGLIVNRLRNDLIKYIGGAPSVLQRVIIERCVWLQLRVALLDKKIAAGHAFTEVDSNCYISWSNALVRTMARLGFEPKRNGKPSLDAILAEADDER